MPATSSGLVLRFGIFEMDIQAAEVRKNGARMKLSPQAFQVLKLLVINAGELQTREHIHREIWGNETFVDFDRNLNVYINQIREALNDSAETPRFIQTIPRRGYCFIAPVSRLALGQPQEVDPETKSHPRRRPWILFGLCVSGACLAGLLFFVTVGQRTSRSAGAGRILLAVLPFENLNGDPPSEVFLDGLLEEFITQLGSVHPARLGVIGRTSVMRYRSAPKSIEQIGHELKVDYLVEGSVQSDAAQLHIRVRLVRSSDQAVVWNQSYTQVPSGALQSQQEMAIRFSAQIARQLFPAVPLVSAPIMISNGPAYEAYRNGRYLQHKGTGPDLERSIAEFNRGVSLDPQFAECWSAMSESYAILGRSDSGSVDSFRQAGDAARKGIALREAIPEAHNVLANVLFWHDWQWEEAEKRFQRAIEINPGFAAAHHDYAFFLVAMRRTEQALASLRRAIELDPLSARVNIDAAWLLIQAHRFEDAVQQARRTLELEPGMGEAHACLARALQYQGNYRAAAEELLTVLRPSELRSRMAERLGKGDPSAALRLYHLGRVSSAEANSSAADDFASAMSCAFLRENSRGLDHLELAFASRNAMMPLLQTEYAFDSFRAEPRFQALLKKMKLGG